MNLDQKVSRKNLLRLGALSVISFFIKACTGTSEKSNFSASDSSETLKPLQITPDKTSFKLYKKGDTEYEQLRRGFNKRIQKFPAYIAVCNTTEEVAQAVNYGRQNKLQISVKSGGHSFEGFSSNNDGLVINVSSMNAVKFETNLIISVQPGCTLSQLYDEILPKNKIIPAGSCGSVGVAGLTLGGGYGLFSRKYGLTCDSLTEITMVDGRGNILTARNEDELLWACKGGGNGNFGIITEMKFTAQPAPEFLKTYRFRVTTSNIPRIENILKKWFEITQYLPVSCFSAFVLNHTSLYILLTDCGENDTEITNVVSALTSITDKTTIGKKNKLASAVKVFYGVQTPLFFKNSSAGLYESFTDIENCITAVIEKVTATKGMIFQINTLGGKINDPKSEEKSAYPHRNKSYLSELQTYWDNASQTENFQKAFAEVQNIFYSNGVRSQYVNYPDINFKNTAEAYYGANYQRLLEIKRKFDPENNFRYEQSLA